MVDVLAIEKKRTLKKTTTMHTFMSRANAVCAFSLTTLAGLTFLCFASTFFNEYSEPADIEVRNVHLKNVREYIVSREKNDLGSLRFDLAADLRPMFNWNVKQLFVYLLAQYETKSNKLNQVVLWDRIIRRGDNAVINVKHEHPKYYFWDDGNGLLGNDNVTLSLNWNVIPNAGILPLWPSTNTHKLVFPSEYSTVRMV